MNQRILTGNEAVAFGALRAGVKVVTGYPGTPSTGCITSLLKMGLPDRHIEWSTNEKVAFEIAAGAAWAGHRALCTMKMSGVNVASDSIFSIAYSGVNEGLVIYVADDSGVSAGMCEQDSRGYAVMADLPILEPASVAETYKLIQVAFDLSKQTGSPVFIRLVTTVSNAHAAVEIEEPVPPTERGVILDRDITKYTKASSAICTRQHHDLIARLEKAYQVIMEMGLNELHLARARGGQGGGGVGIIVAGVMASYLQEGLEIAAQYGFERNAVSVLRVIATNPFPTKEVQALLQHCDTILILEELEPHLERGIYIEAQRTGFEGGIIGKLDGTFSRVGEYGVKQVVQGIGTALDLQIPEDLFQGIGAEELAAKRPITVCAGCPHRGTFMAINQALEKLKLKQDEVMVTGDIGCTILGMNPPFHTVWNEVSMGASVSLAQGYVHSDIRTPVIATVGDSTFFHAGIPGLINAVQHQVPLTLIVMDNGWTSMTGMQVNPGTEETFQPSGGRRIDLAHVIPGLGVDQLFIVDPYDLTGSTAVIERCLTLPGVKVVLARQECAIQGMRRGKRAGRVRMITDKCVLCKQCIIVTGCPALSTGENSVVIDPALCNGCGLCSAVCPTGALEKEEG